MTDETARPSPILAAIGVVAVVLRATKLYQFRLTRSPERSGPPPTTYAYLSEEGRMAIGDAVGCAQLSAIVLAWAVIATLSTVAVALMVLALEDALGPGNPIATIGGMLTLGAFVGPLVLGPLLTVRALRRR